jgi:hypothetical protein
MAKILDYHEGRRKQFVDRMMSSLDSQYDDASSIAQEYYELMQSDPNSAIERLGEFINRARNLNEDAAFVEAIAGGPNHDWTAPMLDIIGTVYPLLERNVREKGLRKCFNFLGHLRCDYSQNHVELINEPWLAGDLVINEPWFWCGYKEYCEILEKQKTWSEFEQHIPEAKSQFWLALAVIRPKYSSLEVRLNFYRKYPELVSRTLDALAGIIYEEAQRMNQQEGINAEDHIEECLSDYDTYWYKDIKKKMLEKKWIKLENRF